MISSSGVGLLLGQLLLGDELVELALGHLAGLLEPGVDELLLDVLDHDGDVGGGDRLGDLAAHRAAAEDGGLEDEHSAPIVGSEGCRGYPDRRSAAVSGLDAEVAERALQRAPHLRPDEEEVGDSGQRSAALQPVGEPLGDLGHPIAVGGHHREGRLQLAQSTPGPRT